MSYNSPANDKYPGSELNGVINQTRKRAKEVSCPVFITSARQEKETWQPVYDNLGPTDKNRFLPDVNG